MNETLNLNTVTELLQKYSDKNIAEGQLPSLVNQLHYHQLELEFILQTESLSISQKWQTVKNLEAYLLDALKIPQLKINIKTPAAQKSQETTQNKTTFKSVPKQNNPHGPMPEKPEKIPQIKKILLVGSGKGGVGKSTVALNLATTLQSFGLQVGLLDADIYGPSQVHLMKAKEAPLMTPEKKIIPSLLYGIHLMSFGFFLPQEEPAIWRGPMLQTALKQFFFDVLWPDLDVLVVDLPPGTGDVPLSISQLVPIDGAILVSTPQEVALSDTIKGYFMFQKLKVPVIGFVENMGTYVCSHCQHHEPIFGEGGVLKACTQYQVPFLGSLPLEPAIRKAADLGLPMLHHVDSKNSVSQKMMMEIAQKLTQQLFPDYLIKHESKKGFFDWLKF